MPYLSWINEPPIKEVTDIDFGIAMAEFGEEIEKAGLDFGKNFQRLALTFNPWGQQVSARRFIYLFRGKPIGLMLAAEEKDKCLIRITQLIINPEAEEGFDVLIEHAVNLSSSAGYRGRLELCPLDRPRFEALGFVATLDESMTIEPGESGQWTQDGQRWRLVGGLLRNWRQFTIGREVFGTRVGPRFADRRRLN